MARGRRDAHPSGVGARRGCPSALCGRSPLPRTRVEARPGRPPWVGRAVDTCPRSRRGGRIHCVVVPAAAECPATPARASCTPPDGLVRVRPLPPLEVLDVRLVVPLGVSRIACSWPSPPCEPLWCLRIRGRWGNTNSSQPTSRVRSGLTRPALGRADVASGPVGRGARRRRPARSCLARRPPQAVRQRRQSHAPRLEHRRPGRIPSERSATANVSAGWTRPRLLVEGVDDRYGGAALPFPC